MISRRTTARGERTGIHSCLDGGSDPIRSLQAVSCRKSFCMNALEQRRVRPAECQVFFAPSKLRLGGTSNAPRTTDRRVAVDDQDVVPVSDRLMGNL